MCSSPGTVFSCSCGCPACSLPVLNLHMLGFLSLKELFQSIIMADSSGDEELVLERVNSGKVTPKFTVVPKDVEFTFKFKNISGRSYSLIQYSLTKGWKLPYITIIKG